MPVACSPIQLSNGSSRATISQLGAELQSLVLGGAERLWTPHPEIWSGICPLMFPVIGRVREDRIRVGGESFPMPMHGFAAGCRFEVVDAKLHTVALRLVDDKQTRTAFPYAFALTMRFAIDPDGLSITARVHNPGSGTLPFSFGLHPGFRWPLRRGVAKSRYELVFDEDDSLTYTRPQEQLILPQRSSLVLSERKLRLSEEMFQEGGMLLLGLKSRRVTYQAPEGPAVTLSFPSFSNLLLWMRPGYDFLCIEPCRGHGDPVDFTGDFFEKPGIVTVPPGRHSELSVRISALG